MSYHIFTLKFLTPVHFGNAHNGGKLEKAGYICSADSFFSALCIEAAKQGTDIISNFVKKFINGKLKISSLYPYYTKENTGNDMELYLPKPLVYTKKEKGNLLDFTEMKSKATKSKKKKKTLFVRASELKAFLANSDEELTSREFATEILSVKVNCREELTLPYYVSSYMFTPQAGLYFIAYADTYDDLHFLERLVISLGYNGIGGKRSSGYGKYELFDDQFEVDPKSPVCGYDDMILAQMLQNVDSACQMCIAPVSPAMDDILKIKDGSYKLLKRSGFIDNTFSSNIKRQNIYMLAEGSCFKRRLSGSILELQAKEITHPIYRNGYGMFVGL